MRVPLPSLFALVPAAAGAKGAKDALWQPRFLQDYPLAVCNDGTPGAYFFRAGDPGARQWLVYLDGEGWCWDEISCSGAWEQAHATSNAFAHSVEELKPRADQWLSTGIFDRERSPLVGAHIAFVKSCSNDAFMGDKAPDEDAGGVPQPGPAGWQFRGKRILEAVFEDLRKFTGLGAERGDRLVYGGCSAGARGAMVSLDYVASSLAGYAETLGLLDSGLWVPIAPPDPNKWRSFEHQQKAALEMANLSAFISEPCEKVFPGDQRWKCLEAAYRLPFVRTPYFLSHSQYDVFGIAMNLFGHFWPGRQLTPVELDFAEEYRKAVDTYLPVPARDSRTVVFSPACYIHCMCTLERFYTVVANGVKLSELLYWWLNSEGNATARFQEPCEGFNCGLKAAASLQGMSSALRKGQKQVGSG